MELNSNLSTRDKILQFLLFHSSSSSTGSTAKEISDVLGISVNATRQYLIILEKEGLIVRSHEKGTTGRPAILYSLHKSAIEEFPKTYRDFSIRLLDIIQKKYGNDATVEILKQLGQEIAQETLSTLRDGVKEVGSVETLKERLNSIVRVYEQYGKFPELIETGDSFELRNYNCLVFGVVQENPLVCTVDETIVKELTGLHAIKEKCIRNGDGVCLYRFKKNK